MESVDTPDSSRSGFASKLTISAGRVALCAAVAAVLVSCPKPTPDTPGAPSGPGSCWQGIPAEFKVSSTIRGSWSMQFVLDWGDGDTQTAPSDFGSGETCAVSHTWDTPGEYAVRVMAHHAGWPEIASSWSPALTVTVLAQGAPMLDSVTGPAYSARGVTTYFRVYGSDPDGDSMRAVVDWGDGRDTVTPLVGSPANIRVGHAFSTVETLQVKVALEDVHGTRSAAESVTVVVGTAGVVKWFWWNDDENQGPLFLSALVVEDGLREYVYGSCDDDYKFYRISVDEGRTAGGLDTRFTGCFTGHPSMNPVTRDIASGSDEGMMYVFARDLSNVRCWPDWHNQDSLDYVEWGAAAWNDPWLYAGRSNDSIYRLLVTDTSLTYVRSVGLHAAMVDAPAIDAAGSVYFGTDSGYLYKLTADLDLDWRVPLQANGEVHGPAIGADGMVYTVTDQGKLYAINTADGSTRWTRQLESEGSRPAVGDGAVFVGTSFGRFYAVNTSDGSVRWEQRLGASEFSTTPILTTKGLLYAVNEVDVLYCIRMSDGAVIWSCDCPMFLPDRRGRTWMQTVDYAPNPGITSRGDIIVVGSDALYCVKGYSDGLLDTSQPWPKWQHDRYNSGKQQQ